MSHSIKYAFPFNNNNYFYFGSLQHNTIFLNMFGKKENVYMCLYKYMCWKTLNQTLNVPEYDLRESVQTCGMFVNFLKVYLSFDPHFTFKQQQQMMMMLKMQQEQKNRMPIPTGGQHPPRAMGNPTEVQRHPVSQQGNIPVMISLQGHGGVPPSPDKPRGMPMMVNPQVRAQY